MLLRRRISNSMEDDSKEENQMIPENNTEVLSDEQLEELKRELEITATTATLKRTRKENIDLLNTILSEYFDSYLIAGYTAENDEIVVHKITSSRDARAISSLIDDISITGFSPGIDDEDDDFE